MTDAEEHARAGAMAISDLLAFNLPRDPRPNDQLYVWETNALDWLDRQVALDPGTPLNLGAAVRLREYVAWRDDRAPAPHAG